jgi:hypothetical protein
MVEKIASLARERSGGIIDHAARSEAERDCRI